MSLRRALVPLLIITTAIVLGACGGGGDARAPLPGVTPRSQGGSSGAGSILFTRVDGIAEYDLGRRDTKLLIPPSVPDAFVLDPAISPDGAQIAYVQQPPPKSVGGRYDAGSDLWIARRDGSEPRAVFTHVTPNQLVRAPQWEDAGHILAIVQEIEQRAGTTSVTYVLERIDVATGARAHVRQDVVAFGISPDGKRVAYARLGAQAGETLESAGLDGEEAVTLVGPEQNLTPFNSPRYSPDGATVAFASADQTGARADREYVAARGFGPAPAVATDGLPEDIWTVPAGGGTAKRVADLKEDLPAVTWNGDGTHLYVLGANALYDIDLRSGAIAKLGPGSFHGQLTWAP